jgi:N utilization substance protein A
MDLDIKQLALAIKAIAEEKNLPEDTVQEVIEQALAAAWRRDHGEREQEVRARMNLTTGDVRVFVSREVVEEVVNPHTQMSIADATKHKADAKLGDVVELEEKVDTFGRVAAQTAKQVVLQRLREAEREIVSSEFEDKIGTIINGIVTRVEARVVRLDLGKAQGIMPISEQIQGERYYPGQRIKVFLREIERGFRGPQLIVSRGCPEFVEILFKNEVPEMENGSVQIKGVAREAGVRTKLAVVSTVPGVDPVGTFVGGHGTRVQAVTGEVGEQEKIDIIIWSDEPASFIANALSPVKPVRVQVDDNDKKAVVTVPQDQLSIAIGKGGQNVRLASRLTGYEIDIVAEAAAPVAVEVPKTKPKRKEELEGGLLSAIAESGDASEEE